MNFYQVAILIIKVRSKFYKMVAIEEYFNSKFLAEPAEHLMKDTLI